MYIQHILIQNVKLFRHVELNFVEDGRPRMWTVLVGENGLGKTTILQAIAMTASGEARANQLANVPSLTNRTNEGFPAGIHSTFTFGELGHSRREYPGLSSPPANPPILHSDVVTLAGWATVLGESSYRDSQGEKIKSTVNRPFMEHSEIQVSEGMTFRDPLSEVRARNLPGWFVVGYGVDRRLPSPNNAPKLDDPAFQRMASLFDKGPIVATGFADLLESKEKVREFSKTLQAALLNNSRILPRISGVELRGLSGASSARRLVEGDRFSFNIGQSTVKIPATWLSQGYQAMIAWVADLIGQNFWDAKRKVKAAEMEGLVLIDEIDIHLHPTWQVNLIQALKTTFPRLQFVVTTHSPMVLPGLNKGEILRVKETEQGAVVVEPVDESPAVMTGSELYDAFFGINGLFAKEIGEQLRRYSYLSSDPYRSDDEDREMVRIQQALKQADVLPEWEPAGREPL